MIAIMMQEGDRRIVKTQESYVFTYEGVSHSVLSNPVTL